MTISLSQVIPTRWSCHGNMLHLLCDHVKQMGKGLQCSKEEEREESVCEEEERIAQFYLDPKITGYPLCNRNEGDTEM